MAFVKSVIVPNLGAGAHLALWAFRAGAVGHLECCALVKAFDRTMGEEAGPALAAVCRLVRVVGRDGGRVIRLAHPGCCRVTADELSLVAALAAAQSGDRARRDAHVSWLTCGRAEDAARCAADDVAAAFDAAAMIIAAPQVEISPLASTRCFTVHQSVDHG